MFAGSTFTGCRGTNEPSTRKNVTEVDEFSSQKSWLQKTYNKFFFGSQGTCRHVLKNVLTSQSFFCTYQSY